MGLAVALGALAAALWAPSPAFAHPAYKDSDPGRDATVASPPAEVWVEFTEPPTEYSRLEVYDACGRRVDNGDSRVQAFTITVTMSSSTRGAFEVRWLAQSMWDGHMVRGSYRFFASAGDACPGAQAGGGDPQPQPQPERRPARRSAAASSAAGPIERDGGDAGGRQPRPGRGRKAKARHISPPSRAPDARSPEPQIGAESGRLVAQRDEVSAPEGIPWDGAAIAALLSMMIGGAGGLVYAAIMGPSRRD